MTTNVKSRMDELSVEIDQQINDVSPHVTFSCHFDNWWKILNTKCGELYEEAGKENLSVDPNDSRKWLHEQTTKLNDFLSSYVK